MSDATNHKPNPGDWLVCLCQEGHGLCYEIRHRGDLLHFQPGGLEWHHARFMEALDRTDDR